MVKKRIPFEEMTKIYENWMNYSKSGTQADVFKREGWSRTAYFNECYYQQYPDERPAPKTTSAKSDTQPVTQTQADQIKKPKV
jgi:hypothetical protein